MRMTMQEILDALQRKEINKEAALTQIKLLKQQEKLVTFTKSFKYNEPFMKAHIIFGKQMLLGVTNCSIVLEACRRQHYGKSGVIHLHRILFQSPLVLEKGQASISVKIEEKGHKHVFSNIAEKSWGQPFTTASGEILIDEMPESEVFLLERFVQENASIVPEERIEQNVMLRRTKELKAVGQIYVKEDTAAGFITLTEEVMKACGSYTVPPAVLDSGFIIAAAGLDDSVLCPEKGTGMWIPFMIKDIYLKGSLTKENYCKAEFIRSTEELLVINFTVYDKEGNAILIVKEFTFKFSSKESVAPEKKQMQVNLSKKLKQYLVRLVALELKTEEGRIRRSQNFMEMGIDSNSLIRLSSKLEEDIGVELYPTIFFEYQTIQELSDYLEKSFGKQLENVFPEEVGSEPIEVMEVQAKPAALVQKSDAGLEKQDDIAIIGMSIKFPMADTLDEFWENLKDSKDMITEIPKDHWNIEEWFDEDPSKPNKTYSRWGSFIEPDKFDPRFFGITPREAEWMDPQLRILLEKTQHCIEDAGYGKRINGTNTGLFLAMSFHEYWDEIMREHTPIVDYQAVNSVASALAGRLSFLYDLHGISIPIDNACASSLTALHLARKSLQSGESEMAFVAGVNLLLSPIHYVFTSKAKALSPTGHCYAFDEQANGYVPGEGVAVLLLKPLKKAMADGDNIHAVIKGSAVNHVGRANNPTSPRPEMQVRMLKEAWKDAQVSPEDITYIEAHGTGTKLGDPIEINSLKTAFEAETSKRNYCALGSVKAYIGHLEAAAGLAGVIKTVLQMKNKKFSAMPYFKNLNSLISLESSPFYINQSLADWETKDGKPRRAGVSSFGMAGHNAHVILEEYSESPRISIAQPQYLFVISAKNKERLQEYVKSYVSFLKARQEKNQNDNMFGNMIYTLQIGREEMEDRLAVVVKSEKDLLEKLQAFLKDDADPKTVYCGRADLSRLEQSQGRKDEKKYTLKEQGIEAVAQSWVNGEYVEWMELYKEEKPSILSLPAYPFAKERYWRTTVELEEEKVRKTERKALHPLIDSNESTFEEQAYYKCFTTDDFCIQEHRVGGSRVLPGVAYLEMARKAAELAQSGVHVTNISNMVWIKTAVLEQQSLPMYLKLYPNEKEIEFIFEGSGHEKYAQGKLKYVAGEEYREHLVRDLEAIRSRCQMAGKGQTYYQKYKELGLEYGPSYHVMKEMWSNPNESLALLELPQQRANDLSEYLLHPSLMDGALQAVTGIQKKDEMEGLYLPFSIGNLNITGHLTKCCYVHASVAAEMGRDKTFSLEIMDEDGNVLISIQDFLMRAVSIEQIAQETHHYLYKKAEEECGIKNVQEGKAENLLVFLHDNNLKTEITSRFQNAIFVTKGTEFEDLGNREFVINPEQERDYQRLYEGLAVKPDTILYLWADGSQQAQEKLAIQLNQSIYFVFYCIRQFLLSEKKQPVHFLFVYAKDYSLPCYGAMEAFFKAVRYEHSEIQWKMLGIDWNQFAEAKMSFWKLINDEIQEKMFTCGHVSYKHGKRCIITLKPITGQPKKNLTDSLREHGVYLIAGGNGKLGSQLAKYLLEKKQVNIVVMGRGEKADWMNAYQQIQYIHTDLSKKEEVERAIIQIKNNHPAIHGIFQCAGINQDTAFLNKDKTGIEQVIQAKVLGTVYLDELTSHEPLDFFVAYSSLAGITGNIGQCDYSFANNFLDEFARRRAMTDHPGRTLVIHWPFWKDGGMEISQANEKFMVNTLGLDSLKTEDGMEILEKMFGMDEAACIPLIGDYDKFKKILLQENTKKSDVGKKLSGVADEQQMKFMEAVKREMISNVSAILKIPKKDVDIYSEMNEFGFDSITFTEFSNLLNDKYRLDIMPSVFFEYTTLASFIEFIMAEYRSEFMNYFHLEEVEQREETVAEEISEQISRFRQRRESIQKKQVIFSQRQEAEQKKDDIAIIGMSGVMPDSADLEEYWDNLIEGRNMVSEVPKERWDYTKFYGDPLKKGNKTNVKWAGFMREVDKFDPAFFGISPLEAELMDPQQRIFLETTWNTIEDAGYRAADLSDSSTGIFVGVGGLDYLELIRESGTDIQAQSSTGISHCILPNRISFFFNFHGPSEPINTACSSSLVAIHNAVRSIRNGECEQAIAGGINVIASPSTFISFSKAGMLSPEGKCKTFDMDANGYVRGEGSGAIMLKKLSQAKKDGDHIYAVIKGSAVNHGGRAASLTAPNMNAQADLIVAAWKDADIDPSTVTYIEAHGTGTSLGDPVEINGLKKAFRRLYHDAGKEVLPNSCGIGSVKANIGHLETAAGIASVLKVLLAMKHGMFPKTIHFHKLNPYISFDKSPFFVVEDTMQWKHQCNVDGTKIPRRAGISSFGFGGVNAHLVIEEYQAPEEADILERNDESQEEKLILLSARTKEQLIQEAEQLKAFLLKRQVKSAGGLGTVPEEFKRGLKELLAGICNVQSEDISEDDELNELGVGQVEKIQLMQQIGDVFDIEIDIMQMEENLNVERLTKAVFELMDPIARNEYSNRQAEEMVFAINLSDLAYTLQCGREEMNERMVILCKSVKELCEHLTTYIERKENNSFIFTGNAKHNKEMKELICGGREGETFIKMILEEKHYSRLAKLWVLGIEIDWENLYSDTRRKRISLPNYPFLRERYWIEKVEKKKSIQEETDPIFCETEADENANLYTKAVELLMELLVRELKLRDGMIGEDTEFYELGLDSISVSQLNVRMKDIFPEISSTIFFTYKSVNALAEYLVQSYAQELSSVKSGIGGYRGAKMKIESAVREAVEEKKTISVQTKCMEEQEDIMDIAIIGLSGKYPMAQNLDEFWENLESGRDCISEIPLERWDYHNYGELEEGKKKGMYCKWGGFLDHIDQFDPQFFHISPKEAKYMDPQERLFIEASWTCVEDAGYTRKTLQRHCGLEANCSVGVFAGVTFNNYQLYAGEEKDGRPLPVNSQIFSIANRVSYLMNFNGPSLSVDTACSSSLYAVHLACESIKRGECEAALAGGVNLSVHPSKYVTLCEGKFLASDGRCHTFGENGDGYVPGEGVGVIMLKPLKKAEVDGDHIYGVIKGSAVNHDGKTYGFSVPNPIAQSRVVATTLEKAKINPETVSYIEAHGTGTSLGDPIEVQGLTDAFRRYTDKKGYCAIGSVKSNIGHLEAAAGISQITKVLLQMKNHVIVPSLLHSEHINQNIDFSITPFYVATKCQKWKRIIKLENGEEKEVPRRAGISSFGVGGVNVHVVLEEYEAKTKREKKDGEQAEILISAATPEALRRYAEKYKYYFENQMTVESLPDVAYVMHHGRESMQYQICFMASDEKECVRKLDEYLKTGKYGKEKNASVTLATEEAKRRYKLSLPTYPFEEEAYWIVDRIQNREEIRLIETLRKEEPIQREKMITVLQSALPSERYQLVLDDIRQMVANVLEFKPPKLPDIKQGFFDMGVDSILSARLYTLIEKSYGLELYSTVVFDYATIEKLADYILGQVVVEPKEPEAIEEEECGYETIYYTTEWSDALEMREIKCLKNTDRILLLQSNRRQIDQLEKRIEAEGLNCTCAICGQRYHKYEDRYEINVSNEEDYIKLIEEIGMPTHIIHAVADEILVPDTEKQVKDFESSFYSVLALCKALMKCGVKEQIRLLYLYPFQGQMNQPQYEGIIAFAKTMLYENPNIICKVLGIEEKMVGRNMDIILNELSAEDFQCKNIQYADGRRMEKKNVKISISSTAENQLMIREGGTYLITGGTGGLGKIFTSYIASQASVTYILTGRKPLNAEIEEQLEALKKQGSKAYYISCDVGSREETEQLSAFVKEKAGKVDGIIHAAGVLRDSYIIKKTREEVQQVIAPKIYGIRNLDQEFCNEKMDFFLAFSSLASVDGSAGQCDYAYANYFMEGYIAYRNKLCAESRRYGRSIVINWPVWKEGGMNVDAELEETMKRRIGLLLLSTEEGTSAFTKALSSHYEQFGVIRADWKKLSRLMEILPEHERETNEISEKITNKDMKNVMAELEGLLEEIDMERTEI